MATNAGTLTAVAIRNAKPGGKPQRLFDGGRLYLELMPTGARYWRMKYRYGGKEKRLALGVFLEVTLANARKQRNAARGLLRDGSDPSAERNAGKARVMLSSAETFEAIARDWLDRQRGKLAPVTVRKAEWLLGMAYVGEGSRPIGDVTSAEILTLLRKVEADDRHETAHRVKQIIGRVFRYAIATDRGTRDSSADLRGALG